MQCDDLHNIAIICYYCIIILSFICCSDEDSLREDMKADTTAWDELRLAISVFTKTVSNGFQ